MGTQDEHITKSKENETLAASLNDQLPVEAAWRLTILFYAAVHAVQTYFAVRGRYPITHTQRDSSIQRDPHLKNIYVDYREMENLSRDMIRSRPRQRTYRSLRVVSIESGRISAS